MNYDKFYNTSPRVETQSTYVLLECTVINILTVVYVMRLRHSLKYKVR